MAGWLASVTGRGAGQSTLEQGEQFRRRQELLQRLECAAPVTGGDASTWPMTLRGSGERFVRVGGVFSGLFLSCGSGGGGGGGSGGGGSRGIATKSGAVGAVATVRVPRGIGATASTPPPPLRGQKARRYYTGANARRWEDAPYLAERLAASHRELKVDEAFGFWREFGFVMVVTTVVPAAAAAAAESTRCASYHHSSS